MPYCDGVVYRVKIGATWRRIGEKHEEPIVKNQKKEGGTIVLKWAR